MIRSYILTVFHDLLPCIICPGVVIFNSPMIMSKAIQLLQWTPNVPAVFKRIPSMSARVKIRSS